MIPKRFYDIRNNVSGYFTAQYPDTNDCILLDKHAHDIQVDLDSILKRELESPTYVPAAKKSISDSKVFLNELLLKKTNQFTQSGCRTKIEMLRQNQAAQTFNEYASKADNTVLVQSNRKQLGYVIIGAIVILSAVYLLSDSE